MKYIVLIFALFINPALASDVATKDRCANRDVLVTVFELIETNYPPRYGDKTSFSFDPDTILTRSYDPNLDKVTCTAQLELYPDLVDSTKAGTGWVLAANKAGIKKIPKIVVYDMQYVSGSTERFNVRLLDIANNLDRLK